MLKILIADDEAPARNRMRDLLSEIENVAVVAEAKNGKEAMDLALQTKPDLMLLDIRMPVMDGITCTKEIRALTDIYYKTVPIIALTAANENTMRDAAYAVGMNDYILKPFEPQNLQEKMLRAINESLA